MHQHANFHNKVNQELGVELLSLPYRGERLHMVVALPVDGTMPLAEVEARLAQAGPAALDVTATKKRKLHVYLPKFRVEASHNLGAALARAGVRDVFDQSRADLSGMTGVPDLFVSLFVQKAFIQVDEEGTEAAAATAAVVKLRCMPAIFRADRPFLFFIRDAATGLVLFAGRVTDPTAPPEQ